MGFHNRWGKDKCCLKGLYSKKPGGYLGTAQKPLVDGQNPVLQYTHIQINRHTGHNIYIYIHMCVWMQRYTYVIIHVPYEPKPGEVW